MKVQDASETKNEAPWESVSTLDRGGAGWGLTMIPKTCLSVGGVNRTLVAVTYLRSIPIFCRRRL